MSKATVMLLLLASLSAAAGQVLFKLGAHEQERLADFLNFPIAFGLVLYAVGAVLWIFVLSSERLTDVYAFTALTFVFVYAAGMLLLGETLAWSTVLGVFLVLAGLYLVVTRPGAA
ncbi:MAG: EamA family transporter [Gammaproteobacteria bacterium]|nr:EamA family transporter [Gammaproteobacteria bacterium]NNF60194.1 EamA family transporter [Gammaproteobacteria bacterium]NNM21607.1 EamA family transporter [Gammaproteobacteria bacterium]